MKPAKRRMFENPQAVAQAMANAFILYARTIALNDAALAAAALARVRTDIASEMVRRGFDDSDRRAVLGAFDLVSAALAPEDRAQ